MVLYRSEQLHCCLGRYSVSNVIHIQQEHQRSQHCALWKFGEDVRICGGCPIDDYSLLAMTQPCFNPLVGLPGDKGKGL